MKKASQRRIAIANRGEVAVRIIHAARELGMQTLLLHSEADTETVAYRWADHRICIGPAAASESYLNIAANVEAALRGGADAVHPGFGFLSERAEFAAAVEAAGLRFIGPRAESIAALGDKVAAKQLLGNRAPTVPGYLGEDQRIETLVEEAARIGFPVLVKAAAGGGGRGMKILRNRDEASELIASAQREALSSFGASKIFLEKYLDRAKHIEFQVFGNGKDAAVHLFERECSVQRRHQKIVEEALSPSLTPDLRTAMGDTATLLARSAHYRGAGTVEFLVQDGKYYFLEMNTRLQVEHPVTELVLGMDLVKAQILLAFDEFSLWNPRDLHPRGHSIECRLYAEDPAMGGMPSTGKLLALDFPHGPGRRFDCGFEAGDDITPHYDPMLAKLIVWDIDRAHAIEKALCVLNETVVFGVRTNIPLLRKILDHRQFREGTMTTRFFETELGEFRTSNEVPTTIRQIADEVRRTGLGGRGHSPGSASPLQSGWRLP